MATKRRKKTQAELLREVADKLDQARRMESPDISINLHFAPPTPDTPRGKRLLEAIKELRLAYQDFYGRKKINLEINL